MLGRYVGRSSAMKVIRPVTKPALLVNHANMITRAPFMNPLPGLKIERGSSQPFLLIPEVVDEPWLNKKIYIRDSNIKRDKDLDLPNLPSFTEIPQAEIPEMITKKLELCMNLCNFFSNKIDIEAKQRKGKSLNDLIFLFNDQFYTKFLGYNHLFLAVHMFEMHFDRSPYIVHSQILIDDEKIEYIDMSWPHMSLVYELLILFLKVFRSQLHLPQSMINNMIALLNTPDANERDELSEFFVIYLQTYQEQKKPIFMKFKAMIIEYNISKTTPYCISPILKILLKFPKTSQIFLEPKIYTLSPLFCAPHVSLFFSLLLPLIEIFTAGNEKVLMETVKFFMLRFPVSPAPAQIIRISILNSLVEQMKSESFQMIYPSLFYLYAKLASSGNSKVCQVSFLIWQNPKIRRLMVPFSLQILDIMYPSICNTLKTHWSQAVKSSAVYVIKSMQSMEPAHFERLHKLNPVLVADDKEITKWEQIIKIASNFDSGLDAKRQISNMKKYFYDHNDPIYTMEK